MDTRILSSEDIRRIALHVGLDTLMDEMIERLRAALFAFHEDDTVVLPRNGFRYDRPAVGLLEWMPCMKVGGQATIKVVGYHPANLCQKGLPTILATVSEYDTSTGHLRCVMDGTFITALRTGAASAVATNLMASRRAGVVGILGAGAQAITQLHALSRVLSIKQVLVYDSNPAILSSFARRASCIAGATPVRTVSLEHIVRSADILCTATSLGIGEGPLFDDLEPQPWLHVNAIGSDFPGKVELPASLLKRSFVCPDSREQAVLEGECQQLDATEIGPSLSEVVQQPARYAWVRERLSVFDSTGWALEDHVAMNLMLDLADGLQLGNSIAIEAVSHDAASPYDFILPAMAEVQRADGIFL